MCRCYTLRDSEIRKPGQQRKMIKKDREVSMAYKRILTIQDISCVGQCSLTVALPILSACSLETAILPSAVLSTHTAGFHGFTFTDLTEEFPKIEEHWMRENISFSAVYTGYLGSVNQISYVKDIVKNCMDKDGTFIVDPAMADFGKLYPPFDKTYVEAMKQLCFDPMVKIILPNITEAAYLTDSEFREEYDEAYIHMLLEKLASSGAKIIVLTGVGYTKDTTGVAVYENGEYSYYKHHHYDQGCHGTGDVYASAFTGAYLNGKSACEAAKIAADYTLRCIEKTHEDEKHWYGVKFELVLPELEKAIFG